MSSWDGWVRGVEVEPSLYAADFARLGDQIEALLNAGCRIFHFDVGDGNFVEPVTMGPIVLRSIAPLVHERGGVLDCHLMVSNPERHIPQIAAAGGDSVTFHVEVEPEPSELIRETRRLGLGVGISFTPGTPVPVAAEAARDADVALCMSIQPGYSGQDFLPGSLDRIRELRSLLPEAVHVQVDGGVGLENASAVREAGANLFVAGAAIFEGGDVQLAYRRLVRAVQ